jgi:molybdopterin/thiamine biosynthesis adenylyltransferase/rhodanese-related sulfurtransferase
MSLFEKHLTEIRKIIPQIDVEELECWGDDHVIIDVREDYELRSGIIDGAFVVSRGLLESKIESLKVDLNTSIILYCASGVRSLLAADSLKRLGYRNVYSLKGGIESWKESLRPLTRFEQLSPEEKARYHRHIILPEVGEAGQLRLKKSRVLLIGAGGLGSSAAIYLAAAGVGCIGIVDDDIVDVSNLQRQILHSEKRVGTAKVDSAAERLKAMNSSVKILTHKIRLTVDNIKEIISDYDFIVDGSDNFQTKYLVNDTCVKLKKLFVYGSVLRFQGQVAVFGGDEGPCLRCIFPEPPPAEYAASCSEAGVFGFLPGIIGTIQAAEVVKKVIGLKTLERPNLSQLLCYDAKTSDFKKLSIFKSSSCLCNDIF